MPEGAEVGYNLELDRARGFTVTESGVVVIGKLQGFVDVHERSGAMDSVDRLRGDRPRVAVR